MDVTLAEAIEGLEVGMCITIVCSDGYTYDVQEAHNYLGAGEEDGYISEALGNVVYYSAESVLKETEKYFTKQGKTIVFSM